MGLKFDIRLKRRDFTLNVSAQFEKKIIGIYGPSGAGKTSLFRILSGLERPDSGIVELNGKVLTDCARGTYVPPQNRKIGVVFQEKLLFPHLTVQDNLLFGVRYTKKRGMAFADVTEMLDLDKLLNAYPESISGGEQQRVAIGRALLTNPEMLLLDEPFNAVDSELRKQILPYLRTMSNTLDIPMLIISHDLPDIQILTDHIFLMEKGSNPGYGSILDLLSANSGFAKRTRLTNTLELTAPEMQDNGLFVCSLVGNPGKKIKTPVISGGTSFFLTIHPDEIALSKEKIKGISIQNQLPGIITRTLAINGSVLCVVDVGSLLIIKITADAVTEMTLQAGSSVYCLFKANSLHKP